MNESIYITYSCDKGGSVWVSVKGSSPEGSRHSTGSPGCLSWHQAVGIQDMLGQCSQTYGLIFRHSFVEPVVGLDDPYGFLPSLDVVYELHTQL